MYLYVMWWQQFEDLHRTRAPIAHAVRNQVWYSLMGLMVIRDVHFFYLA